MHSCPGCAHEAASGGVAVCHIASDNYVFALNVFTTMHPFHLLQQVIMMVLPIVFLVLIPKLINTDDPEIKKEMQSMNLMNPKQDMPDLSEMVTNFFGGGSSAPKKKDKAIKGKKK
ncbi:putative ER membrane protein complex subunit 7 [Apostichopus japonicus]|uniref:Putative ER membrane protein complex subunit 7 n=1 Tax=Stichopus japonicus TaxID=307972 RepID=A0A2G8K572_STIJA|nr:putative ER membrane protein complex subunit 7 [Apostichopus japonicus]